MHDIFRESKLFLVHQDTSDPSTYQGVRMICCEETDRIQTSGPSHACGGIYGRFVLRERGLIGIVKHSRSVRVLVL